MTKPVPHHSDWPDLPISLLQAAGEPDIPYAQRVYRAGYEAGRALSIEAIQAASQAGIEAADCALDRYTCPHLRQGDSGSQWCELAEQGVPHPPAITDRPPRPDECDALDRVWIWRDESAINAPGWDLEHNAVVVEVLQIQAEGAALGRVVRPLRWRAASSRPLRS